MAISKDQLTVEVVLDSSGAVKGIKDLQGQFLGFEEVMKSASKTSKQSNQITGEVGQLFEKVAGSVSKAAIPLLGIQSAIALATQAFNAATNAVGSFVDAYANAERSQRLLTQAVENAGGRILNTAEAWGVYLDKLQELKAVDADVLRGLVAQAIQMGFSEKQIKDLISATIGLSKVTGDSLDGSFQKLIGTTRGMARGLSSMFPALQNLTEEELRSGEAFAVVASQYEKAADGAGTFTYAAKQASLASGELREDIGKVIIESLNLTGAMQSMTSIVNNFRGAIASIDFASLRQNLAEFLKNAGPFLFFLGSAAAGLSGVAAAAMAAVAPFVLLTGKILLIVGAVTSVITIIEMLSNKFSLLADGLSIAAATIALAFVSMLRNITEDIAKLFSLFGEGNPFAKAANQVAAGLQKSVDNLKNSISKSAAVIKSEFDKTLTADLFRQAGKAVDGFRNQTDKTTASLGKLGETGARVKVIDEQAIQKAANILKDVQKMTEQLRIETAGMNADEKRQIDLKLDAQLKSIDARESELKALGQLTVAQRSALTDARLAAAEQANAARQALANKQFTEQQSSAMKELESLMTSTSGMEERNSLAKLEGLELIRAQFQIEQDKITAIETQLSLTGKLGEEQKKQIERARAALGKGQEAAGSKEQAAQAQKTADMYSGLISSAASGADAVVGNAITQLGKAFGPEGQIIAGAVNLLRMGGEQMKNLGKELIKVIVELPLMLAEGIVGLVEGLLQGVINMLGDPAKLAKIYTAFQTIVPKVITALAKALPGILKVLLDPRFWLELAAQIVRSIWEALKEMVYAVGDLIASIFNGDVFSGLGDAIVEMGDGIATGISDATKAVTGFTEQLFGVQEDVAGGEKDSEASKIEKAFDYGARKTKDAWGWVKKWIIDPIGKVLKAAWSLVELSWNVMVTAFETVFKIAAEMFKSTFEIIGIALQTTMNAVGEMFKGVWNIGKAVFLATWNVLKSVFDGMVSYLKAAWDGIVGILMSVWNFVKSIFSGFVDAFYAVGDFFAKVFDDPIAAFKQLFDDIGAIFANLWESLSGIGAALWDAIKGIGTAIFDTFKNVGSAIWEGLQSIGSKIWDMFKNVGSAIWEGTKNIGSKIGESLSNVGSYLWDGIKGAFDKIKNFFKEIFKFDGGGTGAVEDFLGFDFPWFSFAEGGKVPGSPKVMGDSSRNDTVAALLSPGEFVIPRSKMQDPSNLLLIDAIMSGGKASNWIHKALLGGVEQKASGGEIGNSAYGKWLSKAQSGGIEFHFSMSDLDPFNKEGALRKGIAELDPTNPNSAVGGLVEQVWNGVKEAGGFIGDLFIPDWIKKMWDSITKFLSEVDIKDLVTNPFGAIKDAIRAVLDGANFLTEPFKKMMSFSNKGTGGGTANNEFESKQKEHLETFKITSELQDIIKNLFPMGIEIGDLFPNGINMGAIGRNLGGFVPGSGNTDSVPAMLTPGEFVINKNAAQSLGGGLLNQLNAGIAPRGGAGESPTFNITLNIETSDSIDDTFIRQKLIPTIKQEIRSSSLRGEFLISSKGVR